MSDAVVVVLLAVVVGQWVRARKASATAMAVAVLGLCAPGIAYLVSETVKSVTEIPRPCHQLALTLSTGCPAATDWSFPSNHATVAAAAATAWWMTLAIRTSVTPWTGAAILGMAVLAATTRVLLGVHSIADVGAGLALGAVVTSTVIGLSRVTHGPARTVSRLRRSGHARWVVGSN